MVQTCDERLFVVWRHPTGAPFPIGELSYDGTTYRLQYDAQNLRLARVAGFNPSEFGLTRAFPCQAGKPYESTGLFSWFASRLPDPRRPDYAEILARFGLRPDSHPFQILAKTRGRLETDELGVERELTLRAQLSLESIPSGEIEPSREALSTAPPMAFRCYVTGWSSHAGDRVLDQLAPGVQLQLKRDELSRNDPGAVAVVGPGGEKLGYVPVRYSGHVARALSTGWRVVARLVAVNPPPSPPAQRLMIAIEMSGRPGVEDIRRKLQEKRTNPLFPVRLPDPPQGADLEGNEPILIGPAPGRPCYACDQQIEATEELAIELRYSDRTYWFHEECHKIWDEVRKEPRRRG